MNIYHLTIAVLIGGIVFFLFLLRLRSAVYLLFMAGVSIQYAEKFSLGSFSLLDVVGAGLPILLLLGYLLTTKTSALEQNYDPLSGLYFLWVLLALTTGVLFSSVLFPSHSFHSPFQKFSVWVKLLNGMVIFYILPLLFSSKKQIERLLNCMCTSLIVPGFYGSYQIITGQTKRYSGEFSLPDAGLHHQGVVAYAFAFVLPITLYKFHRRQPIVNKILWGVILVLMLLFIFFTYRRTVWLGVLAQLFTFYFIAQKGIFKALSVYLIAALLIILLVTGLTTVFAERFSHIEIFFTNFPKVFDSDKFDYLFTGRWGFFRHNLIYIFQQDITTLFFGNGIGATRKVATDAGFLEGGDHNSYLILLVDYGIMTFMIFGYFCYTLFKKTMCIYYASPEFSRNYARMYLALLMSFFVMSFGTHLLYRLTTGGWIFWSLSGILTQLYSKQFQQKNAYSIGPLPAFTGKAEKLQKKEL